MVKDLIHPIVCGLMRPIMLWLLESKPRCGYELMTEFMRLTGYKLQPGIVYPFLALLEKEGYAMSRFGERGKRHVRYYSLTQKGENLLAKVKEFFNTSIKEVIVDLLKEGK